jgi:hypothetical protein
MFLDVDEKGKGSREGLVALCYIANLPRYGQGNKKEAWVVVVVVAVETVRRMLALLSCTSAIEYRLPVLNVC